LVLATRCAKSKIRVPLSERVLMPGSLSHRIATIAHELVAALRPFVACDQRSAHQDDAFVAGVHRAMQMALDELAATNCWGPENRLPSGEFWKVAGATLAAGVLQLHAREKPFGYAGDFKMLQMICDDVRHGDGMAWAFDDFFQKQAAPMAVRNRAALVADRLAANMQTRPPGSPGNGYRVISVGSGPARDLARFARSHPALAQRAEINLMDLDPKALEFATGDLTPLFAPGAVRAHRVNLKRLPRLAEKDAVLRDADFIFCSGFFDYLKKDEAAEMLTAFWQALGRHGQLLVFNFAHDNPSRAYMEWLGNWYLTYRRPEELAAVGELAGLDARQFTVDVEPAGVNLYLQAVKN
jgi:extracellular factor (EF) 3-hydroxypalmitic acid methyl ester biosynthesis protein